MQEIIKITTGEQGSPVVSAREVHTFLDVKSRFNDWIKNRIIRYGFVQDRDYLTLTKNLVSGGQETDYALTLDMAKELAMVERTPQGKQARQYFIEAERSLRQQTLITPAVEKTLLGLISQSNQLLTSQQQQLEQLRAEVDQIKARMGANRQPPKTTSRLKATPVLPVGPPTNKVRLTPMRSLIHQKVNDYCERHAVSQSETYTYLYRRLNDVYGVNVYRLIRANSESLLDTLERYGHLDWLYSLIMGELAYSED